MGKILITGANGFLASYLVRLLNYETDLIIGLEISENTISENKYFRKIYSDVNLLISEQINFDIVFNLAAFIPYGVESQPDLNLVKSNILLTAILALQYKKARFVFASSVSVFGDPIKLPLKVNSPFNNPNLYGLSKIAAESIIMNLKSYGIIRFSSIIGTNMNEKSFIPKIIRSAKQNNEITIYGNGSRIQDYIDVRDAARLCKLLGNLKQNMIILGVSGNPVTNREVAQIVALNTGAKINFSDKDCSPSFYYDVEDVYQILNFQSEYTLDRTIREIILS